MASRPTLPAVEPAPPAAAMAMPWDEEIGDPVAAFAAARATCGDVFTVDGTEDRYLFVFDPIGVRSFYALDESVASKGIADWRMLRRKVPDVLFAGRRTLPHDLFTRSEVDQQVRNLDRVLDDEIEALVARSTDEGTIDLDVFAWTRRIGHLVGLTSWGGPAMAEAARTTDLLADLDGLDAADAFVRPGEMAAIAASGHARERAALGRILATMRPCIEAHRATDDLLGTIITAWADVDDVDERLDGIAADIVLVHLASMSNLFAALGWVLVDVVGVPARADRVRSGDTGYLERATLESIRLAQRSVMLRHVLSDLVIDTGLGPIRVGRGATIATLVPLTNTTAGPGLDVHDADRWRGRHLRDEDVVPTKELVTTFGHGRHTCPATGFSLRAIAAVVVRLLDAFDIVGPVRGDPAPLAGQIGGVARPSAACWLPLVARTSRRRA